MGGERRASIGDWGRTGSRQGQMPVQGRRRALPRQLQTHVLTRFCTVRSEKSDEIGGTWNHNRYPGGESPARFGFGLTADA
jgi:hypothetical protein